jgi:hypothetical protein
MLSGFEMSGDQWRSFTAACPSVEYLSVAVEGTNVLASPGIPLERLKLL